MRLFIAVELPKNVQAALDAARRELMRSGAGGRFVPPGNYHITLRFIGESERLMELTEAMHAACRDGRPVKCNLGQCGCFGAGTAYVAVDDPAGGLARLNDLMESALMDAGFARGRAKFLPHVTLARNLELHGASLPRVRPEGFTAQSIVLYESRFEKEGVRYDPLHREELS